MLGKLTPQYLEKKKIPKILIAGLIMASVLGWTGWQNIDKIKNYYQIRQIFPSKTKATSIIDGDTFVMKNGLSFRLLGIDAPNRGDSGYEEAKGYLTNLLTDRELSLEYDTYQDDKFGRILGYVWIPCSQELMLYCHENRMLINELILKTNHAIRVVYSNRKKLIYGSFLNQ